MLSVRATIHAVDSRRAFEDHLRNDAALTLAAKELPNQEAQQHENLLLSCDRQTIVGRMPVPPDEETSVISTGIYIFNKLKLLHAVAELADEGRGRADIGPDILPRFFGEGAIVHRTEEPWQDLGTVRRYFQGNMGLGATSRDLLKRLGVEMGICEAPMIAPGARVSLSSSLSNCVVRKMCRIGSGAVLRNVLLMDGAIVGDGVVLEDAIIGPEVVIPNGQNLARDSVGWSSNGEHREGVLCLTRKHLPLRSTR